MYHIAPPYTDYDIQRGTFARSSVLLLIYRVRIMSGKSGFHPREPTLIWQKGEVFQTQLVILLSLYVIS